MSPFNLLFFLLFIFWLSTLRLTLAQIFIQEGVLGRKYHRNLSQKDFQGSFLPRAGNNKLPAWRNVEVELCINLSNYRVDLPCLKRHWAWGRSAHYDHYGRGANILPNRFEYKAPRIILLWLPFQSKVIKNVTYISLQVVFLLTFLSSLSSFWLGVSLFDLSTNAYIYHMHKKPPWLFKCTKEMSNHTLFHADQNCYYIALTSSLMLLDSFGAWLSFLSRLSVFSCK